MNKMITRIIALILTLGLFTGCASTSPQPDMDLDLLDEIQQRGTLIIGTEGTYSPNSYHDESGALVGFDVEVAQAVAAKLGVEAQFVEAEWDSLFAGMDAGRIDVVVNEVEYSEQRAQKYNFSQPYTYVHGALLVAADNAEIQSFDDLKGRRSAQNLTSSWGLQAESYGAELVSVDTLAQCIDLLNTGRADATLNAETAFYDYLNQHPEAPVKIVALSDSTTSSLIPVRKDNAKLLQAINEALDEMKSSGELAALSEKYFGSDITNPQ
ncbi:amino acid ABC transporter substrate-binding protein [Holdemania massiliensis]|uniref:amino acid ABC transporter substrate-binding protein n=1 Tax=Holdemania massiliensis TaxID=1468449 RepID=UPI0002D79DB7|nr:amino acid ABC transporter substrate-binding protein [Holdemania massiliensis]